MEKKKTIKGAMDPRTHWALERTYLAWLRTGLALMGFGFVVARFGLFLRMLQTREEPVSSAGSGWSMVLGTVLVLLGALVQTGALMNYLRDHSRLRKGKALSLKPSPLGIATAVVLILVGLAMAFYLLSR